MSRSYTTKFISPGCIAAAWDVSRSFLWRLEKKGLLTPFYLNSRKLYRVQDVERCEDMIERGELRAAQRGAAAKKRKPGNSSEGEHGTVRL